MTLLKAISRYALPIAILFLLSSCNAYLNQPMKTTPARIAEKTSFNRALKRLPKTKEPMVVGVYKFRDQTGQYKPTENGASWSTAVTQGATSLLIEALEDSGWFVPIERENIGNLLNERKIIRSSKIQYSKDDEKNKPLIRPLLFAGIILEGGIVSYDANVISGGAGVRYFGAGGSGQYRQDRVTVCLRAISTQSGKILKSVYVSKTLLSQKLDVGIFRYVSFKRLLEFETGITYNEPADLAVTEAIEKAVYSLVMEGLMDGLWQADPEDKTAKLAIQEFKKETQEMAQIDVFGTKSIDQRMKSSIQIALTGSFLNGDYPNSMIKPGAEIGLNQHLSPSLSLSTNFGYNTVASKEIFSWDILYLNTHLQWTFIPNKKMSPIVYAGGGLLSNVSTLPYAFREDNHFFADLGVGFQVMLNDKIELQFSGEQVYFFKDDFDVLEQGKYGDQIWRSRLGLRIHFGKK